MESRPLALLDTDTDTDVGMKDEGHTLAGVAVAMGPYGLRRTVLHQN